MDKKVKLNLWFGSISYVLSFLFMFYYLIIEFSIIELTSPIKRLVMVLISVLLMFIGSKFYRKTEYSIFDKLPKINLYLWFVLYIIMIFNLTLFDSYFGRSGGILYSYDPVSFKNYFTYSFNIIPFKTINNYLLAFHNGNLTKLNLFYNIGGNIIAFMPLGFFLPRVFKEEKWYVYFIFASLCIIFVEAMQLVTNSGSFDIDDYILNIFGFVIIYLLLNNKFIRDKIDRALML